MKQSEKPAVVAGAFLMTFAAVILTSLVIQLLDFGIAPSAFALALSNFGRMLYTVYGISSFLIPVYLFVSAIMLYLPGFTKRRGVYLLFSIIPFFTIVGIEKFGASLFASEAAAYKLLKNSAVVLVSILLIAIEYLIIGIIVDSVMGIKKPSAGKSTSVEKTTPVEKVSPAAASVKPVQVGVGVIEASEDDIPELPYADEEAATVQPAENAPVALRPAPKSDREAVAAENAAAAETAAAVTGEEAPETTPAQAEAHKEEISEKPIKFVHRAEVDTTAAEIDNIDREEPITVVFGAAPAMNVDEAAAEVTSASVQEVAEEAVPSPAEGEFPQPAEEACNTEYVADEEISEGEDEVSEDILSKLDDAMKEFELPPEASIPDDVPVTPISLTPAAAAASAAASSAKHKGSLLAAASAYNVSKAPSDSVIHMTPTAPAAINAPSAPAVPAAEPAVPVKPAAAVSAAAVPVTPVTAPAEEPEEHAAPEVSVTAEPAVPVYSEPVYEEPVVEVPVMKPGAPAATAPDNSFEPSFEPTFGLPEEDEPPVEPETEAPVLSESDQSEVDSALKEIDASLYSEEEAAFFDDPFEEQLSLDDDAGGDADEGDDKIPFEVAPVKGAYSVPTEGILNNFENNPYWIIDDETKQAGVILKETLSEFKIEAEVTGIRKGPVVTMFEILPAPGVKLTKIVALQDNIALRLAASSVRIVAPIPGKQAVGVEVPNRERAMVSFRELIEKELPAYDKMQIPVVLGKDITGDAQVLDLAATPHLLIAGSTGSGKSVCVNSMILSILYKRSPNDVKLILIDPKIVELKLYNDIPHLLTPVITEPKKAFQSLQYCLCEMERRYAMLDHMGVRDIKSYNKRIKERHVMQEKLPYIVVVIDEFADLMATTGKELESTIARLCAMSRAVGIHLVLATQRPSIDVITGLIKANIPTRIAFMVASKTDSRIIIDQMGAEKLLGKGDMLYASAIDPFPVRIQGTFVTDDEVENVVEYVKKFGPPEYIDEEIFVEDEDDETAEPSLFGDGEDPLYDQALEIVVQAGKASASYIQRRLKIGYNRAARLVEEMEERGIVGPANGSKPREIIHIP